MRPKKALCVSFSVAPNLSISLHTYKHFRGPKPILSSSPGLCLSLPCCGDSTHRGLRATVGAFQARQTDRDRSEYDKGSTEIDPLQRGLLA